MSATLPMNASSAGWIRRSPARDAVPDDMDLVVQSAHPVGIHETDEGLQDRGHVTSEFEAPVSKMPRLLVSYRYNFGVLRHWIADSRRGQVGTEHGVEQGALADSGQPEQAQVEPPDVLPGQGIAGVDGLPGQQPTRLVGNVAGPAPSVIAATSVRSIAFERTQRCREEALNSPRKTLWIFPLSSRSIGPNLPSTIISQTRTQAWPIATVNVDATVAATAPQRPCPLLDRFNVPVTSVRPALVASAVAARLTASAESIGSR